MSLLTSFAPAFGRPTAALRESGLIVKPVYDLVETAEGYALNVYLPGVAKDGLALTAESGAITITGRRAWKQPEGWTPRHRESADGVFELVLTHDDAVDLDKIQAELNDGVLRVKLAKAEAIKPRKIAVS